MDLIANILEFSLVFFSGFSTGIVLFIIIGYAFIKKGKTFENLTP